MSVDTLGKLFGSNERVKLLKLFLFRGIEPIDKDDIAAFTMIPKAKLTKELTLLEKVGFIKKTSFFKPYEDKKKGKTVKKRTPGYRVEPQFRFFNPLKQLLISTTPISGKELTTRLNKVGKLSAIIVSGLFLQDSDSIVDLLVVADEVKNKTFANCIKTLESEIGTSIRYTLLSTKDFKYRITMYDRLVRDILDYQHQVVYDKIGIENY